MKVGDAYQLDRIGVRDLVAVGRKLRIPADEAEARVIEIRTGLAEAFDAAAQTIASDTERAIADRIASAVAAYASGRGWID